MPQQVINIGTVAGDGTGDTLRESQRKANENFSEIYTRYAPNLGVVVPTDTPAGTGINYWECIEAGTYTNFGGVVLGANSRGTIFRNLSGVFSISQVAYDVTSKVNVSDVIDDFTSSETEKPGSANNDRLLNEKIENLKLQSFPFEYSGGASSGATYLDKVFTIPTGQTGENSYVSFNKLPIDVSKYFVGQEIIFKFSVTVSKFSVYTNAIGLQVQKWIYPADYVSNIGVTPTSVTEEIIGITKKFTYTYKRILTQSDIDNSNYYRCLIFLGSYTAVSETVTVTIGDLEVLEAFDTKGRIEISESNSVVTNQRIDDLSNEILISTDAIPNYYALGSATNGASAITDGYSIPIASNGSGSYFTILPAVLSLNANAFINQKLYFNVVVKFTNYLQLSSIPTSFLLQRWANGGFVSAGISPTLTSFTDVIAGANLTRTYNFEWIVTQSDLDNSYGYSAYLQLSNANAVASVVNVTAESYSIQSSNSVLNEIDLLNQRVSIIDGNTYVTKTVRRFGTVGVDCDYTGRRAVQDCIDAITDASGAKQYIIKVIGIFEATQSSHFDKSAGGQLSFVLLKPYIHLVGINKDDSQIIGFLPNNLTTGFAYQLYQTVRHDINNSRIENLTITGENLRYPLHIDGGRFGCKDYIQNFKSCKIWHKGNTGDALTVWAATTPFGLGMSDGQEITLEDCEIKGKVYAGYVHTNESFTKPSVLKYIRTKINHNEKVLRVQSLGSGVRDKFILQDCVFDFGSINYDNSPWIPEELINQRADHAEIEVVINDNPIAFDNSGMTGKGLRIKSKSTGASSTVTFDQNSTAFNLIIGNSNESTEIVNRYNRKQIYGYQRAVGGQALKGYAIGLLDIGQYLVGISSDKYIGALGKRLGNCSAVNKTLTVIVDGTSYNIVFDKNYNGTANTVAPNYSNATIIAEITAVIGAVADVDEYVVGQDYYPQFNNVYQMINADATEVLSGMGVVFTERKSFRKAVNSDYKIDGICLDDVIVGAECRIITAGEINSELSGQRFSTKETTAYTLEVGHELGISTTEAGKFDLGATPKVLKAVRTNVLKFK
jgi:hypothetical protein